MKFPQDLLKKGLLFVKKYYAEICIAAAAGLLLTAGLTYSPSTKADTQDTQTVQTEQIEQTVQAPTPAIDAEVIDQAETVSETVINTDSISDIQFLVRNKKGTHEPEVLEICGKYSGCVAINWDDFDQVIRVDEESGHTVIIQMYQTGAFVKAKTAFKKFLGVRVNEGNKAEDIQLDTEPNGENEEVNPS